MDARITKSRLSNMLSYDWLKIIVAIVAAVLGLSVFFTTVAPRPREHQIFTVYAYRELADGEDAMELADTLKQRAVFSYDILNVESESFGTGQYSETAYVARMMAGEGTAMFTTTNSSVVTVDGEERETTVLEEVTSGEDLNLTLDTVQYLTDCENYLIRFFGENWRTGDLNRSEAERCFLNRNEKDRRFRSEEKRAAGIESEYKRLESLREDFALVSDKFADGTLSHAYVRDGGEEYPRAFRLGKLKGLSRLYYYPVENDGKRESKTENICLVLFHRDDDAGKPAFFVENDLRYEAISFLRYLIDRYGD